MSAGRFCLKCLLIVCNVLLGIVGLVLLCVGIFVKVGAKDYINKYAGDVIKTAITLPGNYAFMNFSSNGNSTVTPVLDFTVFFEPIAAILIGFGAALAVVAFLGVFGAACDDKCFLGIHTIIVGIIIILQIILTITVFTGKLDSRIRSLSLSILVDYYVDIDDFGAYSFTWNFVMLQFRCCGVNNYEDFWGAKRWKRTRTVAVFNGDQIAINLTTPIACCQFQGQFPNIDVKDKTCALLPTPLNSNWMTGCWDGVTSFLSGYRRLLIGIVTAVICFESLFFAIAVTLLCSIDNGKVDAN